MQSIPLSIYKQTCDDNTIRKTFFVLQSPSSQITGGENLVNNIVTRKLISNSSFSYYISFYLYCFMYSQKHWNFFDVLDFMMLHNVICQCKMKIMLLIFPLKVRLDTCIIRLESEKVTSYRSVTFMTIFNSLFIWCISFKHHSITFFLQTQISWMRLINKDNNTVDAMECQVMFRNSHIINDFII